MTTAANAPNYRLPSPPNRGNRDPHSRRPTPRQGIHLHQPRLPLRPLREANRTYPPHLAATVRYRRKLGQQPRKIGITYEHGTRYGYIRGGCRCPGCTEATRLYQAAYRARRKAAA